ncbi:MAG: ribosome maturation factor RimP [Acidobacteria bacterium]|nr:ribosome maturation factor RimP [Acidobacteriota bacterium]
MVEPIAASKGFELVHLEIKGDRRHALLRVYIDKPGGITVDDCADFSGYLSTVLDVEDPIPYRYTLEVASPGIEREFYKKSDYERFRGESVKIQTHQPVEGRRTFHGTLIELRDEMVRIEERTLGREVRIPFPEIRRTQIEYEWKRR